MSQKPARTVRQRLLVCYCVLLGCLLSPARAAEPEASKPLVITRGGTYSGHWQSGEENTPAVRIDTLEPVTLTNCRLQGPGHLVHAPRAGSRIEIRNCVGVGVPPGIAGRAQGRFLSVLAPRSVIVVQNAIKGTSGIYVDGARTTAEELVISRNKANDIDGRHSDGRGGYLPSFSPIHFVQLNNVRVREGAEIAWNEVVNRPGTSRIEDHVNIYRSRGTPERPIRIHDNYLQGAYPAQPLTEDFSGGGIVVDGPAGDEQQASAHVAISDNQVVATTNYGIGVASGNHITILRNHVVSSGRIDSGPLLASANVGLYIWDMNGDRRRGAFFGIRAQDNYLGWINKTGQRADAWTPGCEAQACSNNHRLPDPIGESSHRQQALRWQQKLSSAGIRPGVPEAAEAATAADGLPRTRP